MECSGDAAAFSCLTARREEIVEEGTEKGGAAWTLANGVSDAHCHLQWLPEAERATFFVRKREQGIRRFLCCATSPADWGDVARIVEAARAFGSEVVPCFGVHPWFVRGEDFEEALRGWLARFPGAWVGECGLDGTKHVPDTDLHRREQDEAFSVQWKLAAEARRPMALHAAGRGTAGRLLEFIRALKRSIPGVPGGILHGSVVSPELALSFRKEGFRIGIGASALAAERLPRVQKMLSVLTAEDVCLESDGTDLAPHQTALRALCEPSSNQPISRMERN